MIGMLVIRPIRALKGTGDAKWVASVTGIVLVMDCNLLLHSISVG